MTVKFLIAENINLRKLNTETPIVGLDLVEWFPFCRAAQSTGWSTHREYSFCFLTGWLVLGLDMPKDTSFSHDLGALLKYGIVSTLSFS